MCKFDHKNSRLELVSKPILAKRYFQVDKNYVLKSLYQDYYYSQSYNITDAPKLNDSVGFYTYNYYNYNYYYNFYNNDYNYNNYSNYNYYNYNYYNYIVKGLVSISGNVVIHSEGYRSERMKILALLSLKDNEDKKFLKIFNNTVENTANKIQVPVIPWQNNEPLPIL